MWTASSSTIGPPGVFGFCLRAGSTKATCGWVAPMPRPNGRIFGPNSHGGFFIGQDDVECPTKARGWIVWDGLAWNTSYTLHVTAAGNNYCKGFQMFFFLFLGLPRFIRLRKPMEPLRRKWNPLDPCDLGIKIRAMFKCQAVWQRDSQQPGSHLVPEAVPAWEAASTAPATQFAWSRGPFCKLGQQFAQSWGQTNWGLMMRTDTNNFCSTLLTHILICSWHTCRHVDADIMKIKDWTTKRFFLLNQIARVFNISGGLRILSRAHCVVRKLSDCHA